MKKEEIYVLIDDAQELPTFETEVQKLAESFGVKVKNLEYEQP